LRARRPLRFLLAPCWLRARRPLRFLLAPCWLRARRWRFPRRLPSHQYRGPMTLYRDTGVVLRTYRLGEADRIVVLMTAQHGKVRAVAKGVRKVKSRFGGRLEPISHASLLLYEGRQLD